MTEDLKKIVVITGAGSGIGRAAALLFAGKGDAVIVSDVRADAARDTVQQIAEKGGTAIPVRADVSDLKDVRTLINTAVEHFGRLDVMVNNAGIGPARMDRTAEHSLEDWERVIAVNQTGVFYCMKTALQQMMDQGSGNIVNVASLAGLKGSGNNLSYTASKFAVVGMTKSAALEYANKNIRINAVCPGYTQSALLDKVLSVRPDMEDILKSFIPMKRFGEPEEIAEAIYWLASDASTFITGHALVLDGGTSV
jgi:NAD(P)-dependent dehydrogenase (short-subunit alcohol dehydrogenase family)